MSINLERIGTRPNDFWVSRSRVSGDTTIEVTHASDFEWCIDSRPRWPSTHQYLSLPFCIVKTMETMHMYRMQFNTHEHPQTSFKRERDPGNAFLSCGGWEIQVWNPIATAQLSAFPINNSGYPKRAWWCRVSCVTPCTCVRERQHQQAMGSWMKKLRFHGPVSPVSPFPCLLLSLNRARGKWRTVPQQEIRDSGVLIFASVLLRQISQFAQSHHLRHDWNEGTKDSVHQMGIATSDWYLLVAVER